MLKEVMYKRHDLQASGFELLTPMLSILEVDKTFFDFDDTTVGDSDPKHVRCEIAQGVVGISDCLGIDDPVFLPNSRGNLALKAGCFHLFHKNGPIDIR